MRYFDYLSDSEDASLFFRAPGPFSKTTDRDVLRGAVGGLLYIPASNPSIAQIVLSGKIRGLTSMAICLEDSVGDDERTACMENAVRQLTALASALSDGRLSPQRLPLLFVRVRDNDMLREMAEHFVRCSSVLTGVILPKVTPDSLPPALALVEEIAVRASDPFYAMPILESPELMLCNDRVGLLRELSSITDRYFQRILNIRVGATDLCGLYGLRRSMDTSIYSIPVTAGCIADIVRVFGLGDRYTVSGPVWEYFSPPGGGAEGRNALEGLLREVRLDQQNGVHGKTCIHPTQLLPVQASYAVSCEAYQDACAILEGDRGHAGVLPSGRRNKMNELKPHALWAGKLLRRAAVFGVYREDAGPADLMRVALNGEAAG